METFMRKCDTRSADGLKAFLAAEDVRVKATITSSTELYPKDKAALIE